MAGKEKDAVYWKVKRRRDDWHWIYNAMLAGIFITIFTVVFAGHVTLATKEFLSRVFALCCVIGLIVPLKIYARWLGIDRLEAFLFNILGAGPLLFSLLLWSNYLITTSEQVETYRIEKTRIRSFIYMAHTQVIFYLEDDAYKDHEEFRRFDITNENAHIINGKTLKLHTAQGLLGYKVYLDYEVLL